MDDLDNGYPIGFCTGKQMPRRVPVRSSMIQAKIRKENLAPNWSLPEPDAMLLIQIIRHGHLKCLPILLSRIFAKNAMHLWQANKSVK